MFISHIFAGSIAIQSPLRVDWGFASLRINRGFTSLSWSTLSGREDHQTFSFPLWEPKPAALFDVLGSTAFRNRRGQFDEVTSPQEASIIEIHGVAKWNSGEANCKRVA